MNWQLIKNVPRPYDSMIILYLSAFDMTLFAKLTADKNGKAYVHADRSESAVDVAPYYTDPLEKLVNTNDKIY